VAERLLNIWPYILQNWEIWAISLHLEGTLLKLWAGSGVACAHHMQPLRPIFASPARGITVDSNTALAHITEATLKLSEVGAQGNALAGLTVEITNEGERM
jgi:hypothetical protein